MRALTPGNLIILEDEAIVAEKVTQSPTNSDSVHVTYRNRGGILKVVEINLQDPDQLIIPNPDEHTLKAYHRGEHQVRAINKRLQQIRGWEFLGMRADFYEEMCAIPTLTLNGNKLAEELLSQLEAIEAKLSKGLQWLNDRAEQYAAAVSALKVPSGDYINLLIPGIKKNYARKVEDGGFYATYRYNRASAYFRVTAITDGQVSIELSDGRVGHLAKPYNNAVVAEDARYPIDSVVPVPVSSFNQIQQYIDGMKAQEQYRVKVAKLYRATLEGKTPQVFDHRALTCIPVGYGYTPHKMQVAVAQHIGETTYSMDAILYELEEAIKLTRQFITKTSTICPHQEMSHGD